MKWPPTNLKAEKCNEENRSKRQKSFKTKRRKIESIPLFSKSACGRQRQKLAREISSTAAKSSWKTTEAAVKGMRKWEMVEKMNDKEEYVSFIGFEW